MADLETQVADQQARLQDLHAAFTKKLDNDAAAHKAKCAERDSELGIRERVAADKLQAALQLAEAVKEREQALAEREKKFEAARDEAHNAANAIIRELEEAAAARAKAAR